MSVRSDMGCEQTRNNTEDPAASHECARYRVCVRQDQERGQPMDMRGRVRDEHEEKTTMLLRRSALRETKQDDNDTRDDREDAVQDVRMSLELLMLRKCDRSNAVWRRGPARSSAHGTHARRRGPCRSSSTLRSPPLHPLPHQSPGRFAPQASPQTSSTSRRE